LLDLHLPLDVIMAFDATEPTKFRTPGARSKLYGRVSRLASRLTGQNVRGLPAL